MNGSFWNGRYRCLGRKNALKMGMIDLQDVKVLKSEIACVTHNILSVFILLLLRSYIKQISFMHFSRDLKYIIC